MAEINVTIDTFEAEVLKSDIPVLVDFWADWCGPCKMLAPALKEIAEENEGKVKVCKVNVDENMDLAMSYRVASIPAVFLFEGGKVAKKSIGFVPKSDLEALFK